VKILVQGLSKAKALKYVQTEPFFTAHIEKIEDQKLEKQAVFMDRNTPFRVVV
jgi:hypothetical protein